MPQYRGGTSKDRRLRPINLEQFSLELKSSQSPSDPARAGIDLLVGPGGKAQKQPLLVGPSDEVTRQRPRRDARLGQPRAETPVVLSPATARQELHSPRRRIDHKSVQRLRRQRLHHAIAPPAVDAGHAANVSRIGTLLHELRQGVLQGRRHELPGVALRALERLDQALRHDRVANANIGQHHLGEGADVEYAGCLVEALQGSHVYYLVMKIAVVLDLVQIS